MQGSPKSSYNDSHLNNLYSIFKDNPTSQYAIRQLCTICDADVYTSLLKLESDKLIVRSKIDINGKPVTHWKYNDGKYRSGNKLQSLTNSNPSDNWRKKPLSLQVEINTNDCFDSPRKISYKNTGTDQRSSFTESKQYSNQTFADTGKNTLKNNNVAVNSPNHEQKSVPIHNQMDSIEFDSPFSNRQQFSNKSLSRKENYTSELNKLHSDQMGPTRSLSMKHKKPLDKDNNKESRPAYSVLRRLIRPDSSKNETLTETDSADTNAANVSRIYSKVPKSSTLNIHSPEFIPKSLITVGNVTQNSQPTEDMSSMNNFSHSVMTALSKNPVSVLYEFCQQRGMTCDLKILEMEGPPHKPRISIAVFLNGKQFETVVTTNKKEGKRKAADLVIRRLISEGHFSEKSLQPSRSKTGKGNAKESETINKEKYGSLQIMYNHIASLVYKQLAEIINDLSPNDGLSLAGRKVVSAIVMQNEKYESLEVISLATGNRCITGDKLSLQGRIINDSHAEVVARRSFMYFLYKQLDQHISGNQKSLDLFEEFEKPKSMSIQKYYKIKDHIKFHLYISTAPCGDGALFCPNENIEKNNETQVVLSTDHSPIFDNSSQGLLRTKIEGGEGTIPVKMSDDCNKIQTLDGILIGERLRTMSCSDKIARWNYLGIQGGLLSYLIRPVFLQSIILGNLFNAGHLSRAVCCRLEKFAISPLRGRCNVNHPDLVNVYVGEMHREIDKSNELSINWCHEEYPELVDGVTGQLSMKNECRRDFSRISKASFFYEFQKLYKKLGLTLPISELSYREVKSLCADFDEKKKALFLKFHCSKYGSWTCKPVEQSDFTNVFPI